MTDVISIKLMVMDTGPLITLAIADTLDYLLYPGVLVYIPDAVLYEATHDGDALGATAILSWAQKNIDEVRTVPTQVFSNYLQSREANPSRREKDLGERAAIEAVHDSIHLDADERALLLTEDDRALRRVLVLESEFNARLIPITTRDFLDGLERAKRIQSAEEVYRRAEDGGRLASRRSIIAQQHEDARRAVEDMLDIQRKNASDIGR